MRRSALWPICCSNLRCLQPSRCQQGPLCHGDRPQITWVSLDHHRGRILPRRRCHPLPEALWKDPVRDFAALLISSRPAQVVVRIVGLIPFLAASTQVFPYRGLLTISEIAQSRSPKVTHSGGCPVSEGVTAMMWVVRWTGGRV